MIEPNNINMLEHRFSVAPMMDWTDLAEKAKHIQRLDMFRRSHAVPNAAPTLRTNGFGNRHASPVNGSLGVTVLSNEYALCAARNDPVLLSDQLNA
jgi:tRNA-dihydrouridine synthase